MEDIIAKVILIRGKETYSWVIPVCPNCKETHWHGGGNFLTNNPRYFLGSRSAHCIEDFGGYILEEDKKYKSEKGYTIVEARTLINKIRMDERLKLLGIDELYPEIKNLLDKTENLFDFLVSEHIFYLSDLLNNVNLQTQEVRNILRNFFEKKLITRYSYGYRKTKLFINILRRIQDERDSINNLKNQ